MDGRYLPLRWVPAVALSTLLVAGCSLFSSDPDDPPPTGTATPLQSVAWKPVDRTALQAGGTLRIGISGFPLNFNPAHESNSDVDTSYLLSPTTGSAVRVTADGGWEVDKDYARSVKIVNRAPLQVRVRLNRDAVWQGGTAITVDDMVAFVKAHDGSNDKYQVSSTRGYDDIASVVRGADEFEYTVTFERPIADWPRFIYPAVPAAVSAKPKAFNTRFTDRAVPSNGPFVVRSINRKRGVITMEPNHRWWGEPPVLDRIVWRAAKPNVQVKAVVADELDLVQVLPADRATLSAITTKSVKVQVASGTEWTQLTMNGGRGPLRDVKVRQAVAHALDREALARLSTTGLDAAPVVPGSFVLVPGQAGYRDQSGELTHDLTAARKLLDGKKVKLTMPVPMRTATIKERARLIVAQLAKVGIQVVLEEVPDADYFTERIVPLDFDLATFSHEGSAFPVVDSQALFHPIDSAQNFTGIDDPATAKLWDQAAQSLSDDNRDAVVRKVDRRLFRDVPIVPLGVVPTVVAVRSDVANIGASQFALPRWTDVGLHKS